MARRPRDEETSAELNLRRRQLENQLLLLGPSLATVTRFMRGLQDDLAPTYVRTFVTNVSTVLTAAVDAGLIVRNPAAPAPSSCRRRSSADRAVAGRTVRRRYRRTPSRYRAVGAGGRRLRPSSR